MPSAVNYAVPAEGETPASSAEMRDNFLTIYTEISDLQEVAQNPATPGYDIWLMAGQSNMAGRQTITSLVDAVDSRVFQYGQASGDSTTYRKIVPMTEPLKTPDSSSAGNTSIAAWAARTLTLMAPKNRIVLVVPVCIGGTAIIGGDWSYGVPGGTLYEQAITETNACITAAQLIYPSSVFKGVIWAQGESDGDASRTQSAYDTALRLVITGFRQRITGATNSAFVISGMVPEAITNHAGYPAIDAAHQAIGAQVPKAAYVAGISGKTSDNLHYNVFPGVQAMGSAVARASLTAFDNPGVTDPPSNLTAPVITGTATNGQTLTSSNGTWAGNPTSYTYQWKRGGVAISGATSSSYTLTNSDVGLVITLTVTATNFYGSVSSTSAGTSAVAQIQAPANISVPTISGSPQTSQVLSAGNGVWSNSPTSYTYQWKADAVNISGATNASYTLTSGEVGKVITVTVTATNAGGSTSATSAATATVTAPVAPTNASVPVISGTAQVGNTLTCTDGTWNNLPTSFSYQWKSGGSNISGATSNSYTLTGAELGTTITVTVTATNAGGSANATSSATSAVTAPTGYTFEGDTLNATPSGCTVSTGTFNVVNSGVSAWTGKYLRTLTAGTNNLAVLNLTYFSSAANNQTVTWRSAASTSCRDGFLLRPQSSTPNAAFTPCKNGYLFQIHGPASVLRIYRFDSGSYALLSADNAINLSTYKFFRASCVGSTIKFEASIDSATWTVFESVTDSTYSTMTSGPIQYVNGFDGTVNAGYVDNITLS